MHACVSPSEQNNIILMNIQLDVIGMDIVVTAKRFELATFCLINFACLRYYFSFYNKTTTPKHHDYEMKLLMGMLTSRNHNALYCQQCIDTI